MILYRPCKTPNIRILITKLKLIHNVDSVKQIEYS